jgi:hypothetical protein
MDFCKFPREIREKIVELVLVDDRPIRPSKYHLYQPNLGIIETCQQGKAGKAVFAAYHTLHEASNLLGM